MLELINCKVSLFCLLCFPLYTICWWFSILGVREEMKSKLSPWACEIKFASLQSATSIISYILLSLQSVTSICTKLTYQWGKNPENSDWKCAWWGQQWKSYPFSKCNHRIHEGLETSEGGDFVVSQAGPQRTSTFPSHPYEGAFNIEMYHDLLPGHPAPSSL